MLGKSTLEDIFLSRQLIEKLKEKKKNSHMLFIDLEKAYDREPCQLIWQALQ